MAIVNERTWIVQQGLNSVARHLCGLLDFHTTCSGYAVLPNDFYDVSVKHKLKFFI